MPGIEISQKRNELRYRKIWSATAGAITISLCLALLLVSCKPRPTPAPTGAEVIHCFEGAYRLTLEEDEQGRPVLVLHARPDTSARWVRWGVSVAIPGKSTGKANNIGGDLPVATSQDDELILGKVYPLDVKPGQRIVVSFGLDGPGPNGHVFYGESVHLRRLADGYTVLEETRGRGETTMSDTGDDIVDISPPWRS